MTKSQLVELIAERAPNVPRRAIDEIVRTVFEAMAGALKRQQRIEIRGFGSFAIRVRSPRRGRNPKTGEKVEVPRRVSAHFVPGKELRARLNPLGPGGLEAPALIAAISR